MSAFYQFLDKEVSEQEIDIKDFAKYHRFKLDDQKDSISVRKAKELHNANYAKFEQSYLGPAAKNGKIRCGEATLMWIVYGDMQEITNTYKEQEHLRTVPMSLATYWIDFMSKKTIEELWEYGPNVISSGLGIVIDYYREWMVKQKYERIYSKGKTFPDYLELARKNLPLIQGEEMPFDLVSIQEKAKVVIQVRN